MKGIADSRARLLAGSFQGYLGHVDGKPTDARFHHPKGLTVDDKGNVYVADTSNMAIRKIGEAGSAFDLMQSDKTWALRNLVLLLWVKPFISEAVCNNFVLGVTTIAGGKSNVAGYADGPSEDAKFSSDFDVVYVGQSCSLLIVDRGNAALREIPLHQEDCRQQDSTNSSTGLDYNTVIDVS